MANESPFPAYEGDEPFVFVCYAHEDSDLVYKELGRLHQAGFNVWYDEGIEPGAEWSAEIAEHIEQCAAFLFFATPRSVEREYCRREVSYALDQSRNVLQVQLEVTDLPSALRLNLQHRQAILRHELSRQAYEAKLDRALRAALRQPASAPSRLPDTGAPPRTRKLSVVLAVAAFAGLVTLAWFVPRSDPASPGHAMEDCRGTTLAVMPFENLTGDSDNDHLGDVIASEVWNALAGVEGLPMVSMTSTRQLQQSNLDVAQIGARLNASHVVEGSVVGGGDLLRINVQLTNVENSQSDWSGSLDWVLAGTDLLFGTYDEVASKVVRSLPGALQPPINLRPPTSSVEAYLLLERAKNRSNATGTFGEAIDLAEDALALDPSYIDAITAKAIFLAGAAQAGTLPHSAYGEAEELARRAMAESPDDPFPYVALASIYQNREADFSKAILMYLQAVERGAPIDRIGNLIEDLLVKAGEYEALLAFTEEREAFDPENSWLVVQKARALAMLGREEDASSLYTAALGRFPENFALTFNAMSHYIWTVRDFEAAERVLDERALPRSQKAAWRRQLDAARGAPQELLVRLEELGRRELPPYTFLARLFFELGLYEEHMSWSLRSAQPNVVVRRGYWQRLEAWAASDPALRDSRQGALEQYKKEIQARRANAYFPMPAIDFVRTMLAERYRCAPVTESA